MTRISGNGLLLIGLAVCLGGQRATAGPAFAGEVRMLYQFAQPVTFNAYVLLPGGRIHEGVPKDGLAGFDFAKAQSATPKACGTFVQKDGKMKLTWGGGRPAETWVHEKMANGDESMSGGMWLKCAPLDAKQPLNGSYVWSSSLGGGRNGGAAGSIIFRPDGTFTDSASAFVRGGGLAKKESSGNYKTTGYAVTFEEKGGATTSKSIMIVGTAQNPASPSLLFLDGSLLRIKR